MTTPSARAAQLASLALVSCLTAMPCRAAPATSDELAGAQDGRSSTTATGGLSQGAHLPVVPAVSQSKSVELLLQLQDQPQQSATEGRSPSSPTRRAAATATATAPQTAQAAQAQAAATPADPNPLASLKNAILRDAAPRQAEHYTGAPTNPAMAERSTSETQAMGATPRREPGESLLSHPVIRYIRENRSMVLSASLAVLAGIWLTATFSMRRRR